MLRQLAQFHGKDPNNLFMVRIAQGLVHLGKGTLTLSPYHSDRQLLSPVALAGLLATLVSFLDVKNSMYTWFTSDSICFNAIQFFCNLFIVFVLVILGKSHYLLYTLAAAMQPRMLVTFDEECNPLAVPVRVGLVNIKNAVRIH